jgi:hypothetical protein
MTKRKSSKNSTLGKGKQERSEKSSSERLYWVMCLRTKSSSLVNSEAHSIMPVLNTLPLKTHHTLYPFLLLHVLCFSRSIASSFSAWWILELSSIHLETLEFTDICPMIYSFSKYLWDLPYIPDTVYLETKTNKSWPA